jgi:hypothetical protein
MPDEITFQERWRKPVVPLKVTEDEASATNDLGRTTTNFTARFTPDDIERFRTGYVCLQCWEPHPRPFPGKCSLCKYPMRKEQAIAFRALFGGLERDPFALKIEAGLDRVDDTHERNFYVAKNGIVVPKGVEI